MRTRALFAGTVVFSLGAAMLFPATAGADSTTFPPAVDAIVRGDLTEYQWMLPAVNAAEAHTEATGAGVTVAVIDTGADATHPDLEGQVAPGAFIQRNVTTNKLELIPATTVEETSDDWIAHGTHVVGVIAGDADGEGITGIAPDATIMPIHMAPRRDYIRDVQFWKLVAQSIDFSVAQGADVINMSLGGQSSGIVPTEDTAKYLEAIAALCDAVDNAKAAGTVVVAAAGNEGDFGNPENVPASCAGTFTVAALGPSLNRSAWSSFDAAVDIAAPGEDILSADSTVADDSLTPHMFGGGTSTSAPIVSGVAALVIEQHPSWTPDQVQDTITSTAKDLGVPGRDPNYGWGAVDAAASVGAVAPAPQPQNFFAAWYEPSWGGRNGESVVSWMTPAADAATGYTVVVYSDATSSTYEVDGQTVRADVLLAAGDWFTVTAHTTTGDVTSYPGSRYSRDGGDRPANLRGTSMHRMGDTMTIKWDRPEQKKNVDVIRAYIDFDGLEGISKVLKIDQSQPFPTGVKVKLPTRGRWYDAYGYLIIVNKDANGDVVGVNGMSVRRPSPAIHGSHVRSIDRAGARAVEVTGAMSRLNAERICGRSRCSGESAVLVVDHGRSNERFRVLFTSRGVFHAVVQVDRGIDALRVRIEGPKKLDSGPFTKIGVSR